MRNLLCTRTGERLQDRSECERTGAVERAVADEGEREALAHRHAAPRLVRWAHVLRRPLCAPHTHKPLSLSEI